MSQGALSVANGPGGTVRANFNAAIGRLATRASGTGRPADIATGEEWIETDNPGTGVWSQWQYDGSNDILIRLINSTAHTIQPGSVTTTKGDLIKRGASSDARFGVGAAHTLLGVNSVADDLEFKNAGWMRLASDTIIGGAVANISWTSIPSYVKALRLVGSLRSATDNVNMLAQFSQSASFITGASAYGYQVLSLDQAGTNSSTGANTNGLPIFAQLLSNNSSSGGGDFDILIPDVQASKNFVRGLVHSHSLNQALNSVVQSFLVGGIATLGAIDGVRILATSGNLAGGRVSILGLMA